MGNFNRSVENTNWKPDDYKSNMLPLWDFITSKDQILGVEERTVQSENLVVAALWWASNPYDTQNPFIWWDKWVAVFQFWSYDEILDGFDQYPLTAKSVQHIISSIEPERWDSAEITYKKKLVWVTLVNTIIDWLEKNDRTHKLFLQELHLLPKIILQYFKKKVKEHGITLTEDDMEILDM